MAPVERSLLIAIRWLIPSVAIAIPLLAVNVHNRLLLGATIHLSAVVVGTFWISLRLAPLADETWFVDLSTVGRREFAAATAIAAVATGYAALTTLATSAALRLDASLQFLQLLSAIDIAWVVAATVVGTRWIWGERVSRVAGVSMSVVCVWSIGGTSTRSGSGPKASGLCLAARSENWYCRTTRLPPSSPSPA